MHLWHSWEKWSALERKQWTYPVSEPVGFIQRSWDGTPLESKTIEITLFQQCRTCKTCGLAQQRQLNALGEKV